VGRFYVTTPIYYVNDAPHVGHAYTTVHADALARWHRLVGDQVFFLTGTDEHGDKVARAAAERGMSPQAWADSTAQRFKEAWARMGIAYDDFIRTTEPRHEKAVQEFMRRIYDNGYIELGKYAGHYCVACEAYKEEGELVDGKCPDHMAPVEWLEEENYFFKLSAFQGKLLEWYEANPRAVEPEIRRNEALSFIRQGLKDVSITRRSTRWGIAVPWDPEHVFYVWYDALVNYLTAIGFGRDMDAFSAWWPAVNHLLAKDILRFHCVWWPAMCMAAGIDPPGHLFVHGHLLLGGARVSKTRLRALREVEEPTRIVDISPGFLVDHFTLEGIRYYLLREVPFGLDGEFRFEAIVERYNTDLANKLGNLLQRVTTVASRRLGGVVGAPSRNDLEAVAQEVLFKCTQHWEEMQPHLALAAAWELVHAANSYLEENAPWNESDEGKVGEVVAEAVEALRLVALLASPAIPNKSEEILERIGVDKGLSGHSRADLTWASASFPRELRQGPPLFPRLSE
jgi:methionyl-tRNA synthetase